MTEQGYDAEAPVLIIGGGIVGLSAALFLARHGVDAMLVERRASTSEHPRARGVNARTMELFREAGVADEVRAAGAALAPAVGIHSGATVAGIIDPLPRRDPDAAVTARGSDARQAFAGIDLSELGPAVGARGTQDLIEPVLRRAATAAGADLRFGLAARTVEQDGTGADVTLADGSRIRARYVIAADGAGSPIRKVLGIGREQLHPGGHHLNILFEADLRAFVRDREFSICLIDQPGLHGIVTSIDNDRRWVLHANYDPSVESPADFPPQRCAELAQRAIGLPGLDVRVVSVLPWESAARVADRFRADRVFLAGDAAHQMPPWGGLGANTGIADVHNLAWKLAAVLQGRSAPALLASYQPERRPVGVAAARRSASLSDEDGRLRVTAEPGRLLQPAALHGGVQKYTEGALVPEPSGPVEIDLDGRPGTRLPHLWLDAAHRRSTLDLVGRRPVLLTGPSPDRWAAAATRCGIDLHAVVADGSGAGWCARAGIDADGAVLVRPDGIVGWRAPTCPSDPDAALQHALTVVDATVADPSRDPSRAVGVV